MIRLPTWAGKSEFSYTGSVINGTTIFYGSNFSVKVSALQYAKLLQYFNERTVNIGTSRDNPHKGSLGEWLKENVTKTAIASYVGPILVHERYAEKAGKSLIKIRIK